MSRIPNPFLSEEAPPKQPRTPSDPGFLLMTRPPSASNPRAFREERGFYTPTHRFPRTPSHSGRDFIPLSSGSNNSQERYGLRGRGGGRFNHGGRGQNTPRHFSQGTPRNFPQSSPRNFSPYPPRGVSPSGPWSYGHVRHQGSLCTPTSPNVMFDSFLTRPKKGRGGPRPIEEFVSPSMVTNPWANFDVQPVPDLLRKTPTIPLLDDSEIIESDSSVIVESSYEGVVSGTEGSPVPDTGGDSIGDD